MAGDLNKRITIKSYSGTPDGQGGLQDVTETTVAVVWGNIRPLSAGDQFYRQGHQATASHEITIRYRDDVTIGCRLYYDALIFEIQGLTNASESGEFLRIDCEEVFS